MKKNMLVAVMIVFALSVTTQASSTFSDVTGHWGEEAIVNMVELGIVNGYPNGEFRPDNQVTRAEFMKMVVEAIELPVEEQQAGEQWYDHYVRAALAEGVHRKEDFHDRFDQNLTRMEMVRLTVRAVEEEAKVEGVIDDASFMVKATSTGLIHGMADGTLNQEGLSTRAQAVTVIQRILDVRTGKDLPVDERAIANALKEYERGNKHLNDAALEEIHEDFLAYRTDDTSPIVDQASWYYIKPVNGQFVFKEGEFGKEYNYTLKEDLNPYINRQVYDATRALLSEHGYVLTMHNDDPKRVFVNFAQSDAHARNMNNFFGIIFYEEVPFNNKANWLDQYDDFSEEVVISLSLNRLFKRFSSTGHTDPLYENQLRSVLEVVFKEQGNDIADYVMYHYAKSIEDTGEEYKLFGEIKIFGKLQLDYAYRGGNQTFHFSYVGR